MCDDIYIHTAKIMDKLQKVAYAENDIGLVVPLIGNVITNVQSDIQVSVVGLLVVGTGQEWYISDGTATVRPDAGMLKPGDQEWLEAYFYFQWQHYRVVLVF